MPEPGTFLGFLACVLNGHGADDMKRLGWIPLKNVLQQVFEWRSERIGQERERVYARLAKGALQQGDLSAMQPGTR